MDSLLLGVDVGTTAVKAVLISVDGRTLATANEEYPTHHLAPGCVEQDPEDWWHAVVVVIRKVVSAVSAAKDYVAGIAVSAQAPTLLPVDSRGRLYGMLSSGWIAAPKTKRATSNKHWVSPPSQT